MSAGLVIVFTRGTKTGNSVSETRVSNELVGDVGSSSIFIYRYGTILVYDNGWEEGVL